MLLLIKLMLLIIKSSHGNVKIMLLIIKSNHVNVKNNIINNKK